MYILKPLNIISDLNIIVTIKAYTWKPNATGIIINRISTSSVTFIVLTTLLLFFTVLL